MVILEQNMQNRSDKPSRFLGDSGEREGERVETIGDSPVSTVQERTNMTCMTQLNAPVLAFGLFLTSGTFGQVVENSPSPRADQDLSEKTGILTDTDRINSERDQESLRWVSGVLEGEVSGLGEEGRIAAIRDMILNAEGRPHFILISRGGLAGVGRETIAVPFRVGTLIHHKNGNWSYRLNMTGDQLDQAPTLEDGSLSQLGDRNWIRANEQFFQAGPSENGEGTGDETFLFRLSALKDAQVGSLGDQESRGSRVDRQRR